MGICSTFSRSGRLQPATKFAPRPSRSLGQTAWVASISSMDGTLAPPLKP